jgi:hypothetical protein
MPTSLRLKSDEGKLEAIYTWLEARKGPQVQLWGVENDRRAGLLAYSDGAEDDFGWSNWVSKAYDDPSELPPLFDQLELVIDDASAGALNATFLGVFAATTGAAFG